VVQQPEPLAITSLTHIVSFGDGTATTSLSARRRACLLLRSAHPPETPPKYLSLITKGVALQAVKSLNPRAARIEASPLGLPATPRQWKCRSGVTGQRRSVLTRQLEPVFPLRRAL